MTRLIMLMAGAGSRFTRAGFFVPKPLMEIHGAPFFYWAAKPFYDAFAAGDEAELIFAVLEAHIDQYQIDKAVQSYFPAAKVVKIPAVTRGAADTAAAVLRELDRTGPIVIADCDQYFETNSLRPIVQSLDAGKIDGFVANFTSNSTNYSYALYGKDGFLIETAEKRVISSNAIAGLYGFRSPEIFLEAFAAYIKNCKYPELFVSGLYNQMIDDGRRIVGLELTRHVSFGTPEEFELARRMPRFN